MPATAANKWTAVAALATALGVAVPALVLAVNSGSDAGEGYQRTRGAVLDVAADLRELDHRLDAIEATLAYLRGRRDGRERAETVPPVVGPPAPATATKPDEGDAEAPRRATVRAVRAALPETL